MFHPAGVNVIDAKERKRDVLDTSRKALRDMIAKVVDKENGKTVERPQGVTKPFYFVDRMNFYRPQVVHHI
jgi:hypothetical protein